MQKAKEHRFIRTRESRNSRTKVLESLIHYKQLPAISQQRIEPISYSFAMTRERSDALVLPADNNLEF